MTAIFILLIVFQLKHWLADYPLQRPWMLGKFKPGLGFVLPLTAHAAVHAAFTWSIASLFLLDRHRPEWLPMVLASIDFVVHFTVDRVKASPNLLGRWKPLTPDQYTAMASVLNGKPAGAPFPVEVAKDRMRGNTLFWWALGADQGMHHLTHYFLIWMLVR